MNKQTSAGGQSALARIGTHWQIDPDLLDAAGRAMLETASQRAAALDRAALNHLRVLEAFQAEDLGEHHFHGTTGYGLHDQGREVLDRVLARVFGCAAALVRWQFVSGTHALKCALFGWLRPGDEWVSVTGAPYDTLTPVIGSENREPGSLADWGITGHQASLDREGLPDLERVMALVNERTRLFFVQRSCGYTWRPSLDLARFREVAEKLRAMAPQALILVDNCYGEMVEELEPTHLGADLAGGSLIKNLGGTLATGGGYLAGRADAVAAAARHLTAPGIGTEEGATLGMNRQLFQGLFMAPLVVGQAMEGALWASFLLEELGFEVRPRFGEWRTDLIQGIRLGQEKALRLFCRGIQKAGAVDHRAVPQAVMAPGYRDQIVMAGGTFVQGSSLELSADGPLREPYAVYLQGGTSLVQVQAGVLCALQELRRAKLL